MSAFNLEDKLRSKLEGLEPEITNDRWEAIEATLPPQKKRRAFLFFLLAGIGVVAGLFFLLRDAVPPQQPVTGNREIPAVAAPGNAAISPIPETPADATSAAPVYREKVPVAPATSPHHMSRTIVPQELPVVPGVLPIAAGKEEMTGTADAPATALQPVTAAIADSSGTLPESLEPVTDSMQALIPETEKTVEKEPAVAAPVKKEKGAASISRFFAVVQFSGAGTHFRPGMPNSFYNTPQINKEVVQRNFNLRRDIEKGGYTISQGLMAGYRIGGNWRMQLGVQLVQTTQIMRFNTIKVGMDNINALQDMTAGYNEGAPSGPNNPQPYQYPFDSIVPGSNITLLNKYYYREIPVSIGYIQPLKNGFSLLGELQVSYRYLSSGSIYFPDIDNVGFIYLTSKSAYPGIKGTWNTALTLGAEYKTASGFSFGLLPYVQQSLGSNIRYEKWIQQYQRNMGVNVRLTRYFD